MTQTNPSGLDNAAAALDVAGFSDLPESRQDRLLRSANRTVLDLAPPLESPLTEAYRQAARDGEVAVLEFMLTTQGGIVKANSLSGLGSRSFAGSEAVVSLVRNAMGSYFGDGRGPTGTGEASVHNVSDEPLW